MSVLSIPSFCNEQLKQRLAGRMETVRSADEEAMPSAQKSEIINNRTS